MCLRCLRMLFGKDCCGRVVMAPAIEYLGLCSEQLFPIWVLRKGKRVQRCGDGRRASRLCVLTLARRAVRSARRGCRSPRQRRRRRRTIPTDATSCGPTSPPRIPTGEHDVTSKNRLQLVGSIDGWGLAVTTWVGWRAIMAGNSGRSSHRRTATMRMSLGLHHHLLMAGTAGATWGRQHASFEVCVTTSGDVSPGSNALAGRWW
jgi:hypothetical protein